ncbi:uncharacterized protein LOC130963244 [Arachis stenosperma]|uniref:uncharacterized protein LOC130963244 n=1 Tax=Arachis stenosperma TaxID=217475 RepID=UPI0025AD1011|nr:uncharacterized protein LOC130963244 [Arachis stenosperma]
MLAIATPKQRYAFDKIVTVVYCDEGGFFFVYGHGGTGKTFLWNLMSVEIHSRGDIVLNVTSSGIASLLLPNGRTAHSRFKISLNITEDSECNIKPGSPQAMLLLKAKLIIWDEAPMVSRYCYEALDKCLGDIMKCAQTNKKHGFSIGTTASDQDETEQFGEWLLKVGDGLIGDNMDGESEICLPGDIVIPSLDQAFDELVHFSYPNTLENMSSKDFFKARTILAPILDIVEEVGVLVMLPRNIDQSSGLCNGTRLQVKKLGNPVIECEVLTGNNVGHIALIPRMNMVPTNETVPIEDMGRNVVVSALHTAAENHGIPVIVTGHHLGDASGMAPRSHYTALSHKLRTVWRIKGGFDLLDVGFDYFLVKFDVAEEREKVLLGSPWMIEGNYVAVKPWD